MYNPRPIDTSHIQLSPELETLVEVLARNNHELWARRRLSSGWSYGPQRDDGRKQTPLLVSYEDLPEDEKNYDRDDSVETLKVLLARGWTILPPSGPLPANQEPTPERLFELLPNAELSLARYWELSKQANSTGESLLACNWAEQGLRAARASTHDAVLEARLCQQKALALARMGSHEEAREILQKLEAFPGEAEETAGLLARTYKDVWLKSGDQQDLQNALARYEDAYTKAKENYWLGINVATLALIAGDEGTAKETAESVYSQCLDAQARAEGDERYWICATLGEAALILDRHSEAIQWYGEAAKLSGIRFAHVLSTWRNARIILSRLPVSLANQIKAALQVPTVGVFVGHRVDDTNRLEPRFPDSLAGAAKQQIKAALLKHNVRIGYSSAASGGDLLFAEALLEIGGHWHVILPCSQDQFVEESVRSSGPDWLARYENAIKNAREVTTASQERLNFGGVAYDYANNLLYGLATMRTGESGADLRHIALWDRSLGSGTGGTADTVGRWLAAGRSVEVIDPFELRGESAVRLPQQLAAAPGTQFDSFGSEIRAMLFADAYHFSRIGESQMPAFIREFIGPVARLAETFEPAPVFCNTWGDGLFFVFEQVCDAARFALQLAEQMRRLDRPAASLPESLTLRIALHAGPVYRFYDHIRKQSNYIGSHVNRAARMEPVTPPGQIYASDAFAALAVLEAPGEFRFDYVGKIPLAKGFGDFPLYDVRAASRK